MRARLWSAGLGFAVAIYLAGSGVWMYFAIGSANSVPQAADTSFVPLVVWFFHNVVSAAPALWAVAVAAGELLLALLIVNRRFRLAGLALASVWQVFGAGVADGWPVGLINVAIAAGQLALLLHYLPSRTILPGRAHREVA